MKVGDSIKVKDDIEGIDLLSVPEIIINRLKNKILHITEIESFPGTVTTVELLEDGPMSFSFNIELFEYAEAD